MRLVLSFVTRFIQQRRADQVACAAAFRHVQSTHPQRTVANAVVRAREPERVVVAVFFHAIERVVPSRYQLVAVHRKTHDVEELETSPASPYWITGCK